MPSERWTTKGERRRVGIPRAPAARHRRDAQGYRRRTALAAHRTGGARTVACHAGTQGHSGTHGSCCARARSRGVRGSGMGQGRADDRRPLAAAPEMTTPPGWRMRDGVFFFEDEYPGAMKNGTRVVKVRGDEGDTHPLGALATVVGSIGHPDVGVCYFVEWDEHPGVPVAVMAFKLTAWTEGLQ